MALEEDIRVLERAPVIGEIGHDPLRLLAFSCERRTLSPGDALFGQGDVSDGGFVLARGRLVMIDRKSDRERIVEPIALIGELAMLTPITRPVSAVARDEVQVLAISRALFGRVLAEFPGIAMAMRERLLGRLEAEMTALDRVRNTLNGLDLNRPVRQR